MRSQFPQHSLPVTPDNTFGLGIQVYKIESKLPRINSDKNGRRQLIKQLQNPGNKKYQRVEKVGNNLSYDKIVEKQERFKMDVTDELMRRKSILNVRSNTLKKANVKEKGEEKEEEKWRANRPPSGRIIIRANSTSKKQKDTATVKTQKVAQAPSKILQPEKDNKENQKIQIIKTFPAFKNQQLRKLQDKITQVTLRRKQTKRNLRKQLKSTKDQQQQNKILRKIEIIEMTDVVSEIVNINQLAPYQPEAEFQEFGLEEYMLREKGEYEIEDDDEEYELVYKPAVHVYEELEEEEENQKEQEGVQREVIKELQKEQREKKEREQQ